MKITIVRHAKPEHDTTGWISTTELAEWIRTYNSSSLPINSQPPPDLTEITQSSTGIVCSTLRRSTESAELLGKYKIVLRSDLFHEAGLPYANSGSIKLPVYLWTALFRIIWFFGYSRNSESYRQARLRAKDATTQLKELCHKHGHIIYVGHGIFNRLIVKKLLKDGWQGPKQPSSHYWGHAVYTLPGM